jgi:hypothetical protein
MKKDKQPGGRRYDVASKYLAGVCDLRRGLPDSMNSRTALKSALFECGNTRAFVAAVMRRYDRGLTI